MVGIYVPNRPSVGDPYVNAVSVREKDGRVHGRVRVWNTGASQAPVYKVLGSWPSRAQWVFTAPRKVTMCVPDSRTPWTRGRVLMVVEVSNRSGSDGIGSHATPVPVRYR